MMNKKKKRKNMSKFKRFLLIYSGILAAAMIICWSVLYVFIKDYEQGRPTYAMDKITKKFTADNVQKLLNDSGVKANEFETNEKVAEYLKGKLGNEQITYKKKNREYSESNPVYVVYAGDTAIAKVSLQEDGKNGFKFTKWKLGSISFDDYSDKSTNNAITISAPKGSKVSINGVEVSDNYIKQDDVEFSPCKHVASYVSEPLRTIYEVSGLIAKPEIKAEMSGNQLEITNRENIEEIQRYRKNLLEKGKTLNDEYALLADERKKTKAVLNKFYSTNVIYPKYRSLPAIASLFEYMLSERCYGLTGHEGAYNLYENELRLGHIISTLDSISSDIKEIKQNQRMLYDVMSESQKMTKSMFEQQVINGQVLCDIRKSNQIMQYNQSQIANRMEHMHWLEEQKYLWG